MVGFLHARMAELVYAGDLKSPARKGLRVRLPLLAPSRFVRRVTREPQSVSRSTLRTKPRLTQQTRAHYVPLRVCWEPQKFKKQAV